jgi:hypothetical protein
MDQVDYIKQAKKTENVDKLSQEPPHLSMKRRRKPK